jgi:hypothetical protein
MSGSDTPKSPKLPKLKLPKLKLPKLPKPPALPLETSDLNLKQLKRRHIVASLIDNENNYVESLQRLLWVIYSNALFNLNFLNTTVNPNFACSGFAMKRVNPIKFKTRKPRDKTVDKIVSKYWPVNPITIDGCAASPLKLHMYVICLGQFDFFCYIPKNINVK